VQPWAGIGRRVHEDDRERKVPVLGADELVCVLRVRKVVEAHDRGHLSLLLHRARGCYPGSLAARTSIGSITGGCSYRMPLVTGPTLDRPPAH
jgi:hypothetical protein